ncbi:hypothetical protein ACCD10_32760, partial [Pseudomonas sp. Pseusp122]|uniref:hypothetical protein n=1 Tax=unclassified Pseudomonas TaxID=196821 RepID=UPI0039A69FDF
CGTGFSREGGGDFNDLFPAKTPTQYQSFSALNGAINLSRKFPHVLKKCPTAPFVVCILVSAVSYRS